MALVASPDGLAAAASSTTLFHCQSDPPTQDGVYTTHPTSCYFTHTPNHSQYPVRPKQQPANGLQEEEPHPDLNAGSLVSSLPPPLHQPTYHGEEGGAVADQPNPSPHECSCGATFGRRTDLERHQRTTRKHNGDQHGRACPVKGCRLTSKFTRDDNFRTHCRRQHGMSADEVNTYIRRWRSRRIA
ncbi:hypothetical protein B9Z19DRAFT_1074211 [Tuber borchii]|uniref:C2H2-type domain-containing protein n=1 Tax=Tuber borchii TaxID=42251 RepID=A0A2T7A4Z8_TUBBO|nr:hypothetical protein B9Z19DRAFT_1074211 [Tuber borchii]